MMGSIGGYARKILHVDLWEWIPTKTKLLELGLVGAASRRSPID
jgi:hypothetical protein